MARHFFIFCFSGYVGNEMRPGKKDCVCHFDREGRKRKMEEECERVTILVKSDQEENGLVHSSS